MTDQRKNNFSRIIIILIISCGLSIAFFWRLDHVPPLWWDEGWTLSVARNWMESGLYGLYLAGEPQAPILAGHLPVVGVVALSFKVFGVGTWQGRLPGVISAIGALSLLVVFGRILFNSRTAWVALGLALLTPISNELHPVLLGRQALGETPAAFLLLAGYVCLYGMLTWKSWLGLGAILFFGLALTTKAQVLPFWIVAFVIPVLLTIWKKWWREALLLSAVMLGSYWVQTPLLRWIANSIAFSPPGEALPGLYQVTAFVLDWQIRQAALGHVLTFGGMVLLGTGWSAWRVFHGWNQPGIDRGKFLTRLSLLGLVVSWLAWYALFGMYWVRYLFIPVFFGSLFAAEWILKVLPNLDFRQAMRTTPQVFRSWKSGRSGLPVVIQQAGKILLVTWLITAALATLGVLTAVFLTGNDGAAQTAGYLNRVMPPGAMVETYDSELFFMLDRPYHFPPPQVSIQLIQRTSLEEDIPVNYDPSQANADYLVVGPFSRKWGLYQAWLENGGFVLVAKFPGYDIFQRVRE